MNCILCGGNRWRALPIPTANRSITTSSMVVEEPLQREQCMDCGLLRKALGRFLGHSQFYEEQYENYYSRPGAAHYDRAGYDAMAEWMRSALGSFEPNSILDIGCGAGWSMTATAAFYERTMIEGVSPRLGMQKERERPASSFIPPVSAPVRY
jgi:hypothetical protein